MESPVGRYVQKRADIADGAAVTEEVTGVIGLRLVGIFSPATVAGTAWTVSVDPDGSGTYYPNKTTIAKSASTAEWVDCDIPAGTAVKLTASGNSTGVSTIILVFEAMQA